MKLSALQKSRMITLLSATAALSVLETNELTVLGAIAKGTGELSGVMDEARKANPTAPALLALDALLAIPPAAPATPAAAATPAAPSTPAAAATDPATPAAPAAPAAVTDPATPAAPPAPAAATDPATPVAPDPALEAAQAPGVRNNLAAMFARRAPLVAANRVITSENSALQSSLTAVTGERDQLRADLAAMTNERNHYAELLRMSTEGQQGLSESVTLELSSVGVKERALPPAISEAAASVPANEADLEKVCGAAFDEGGFFASLTKLSEYEKARKSTAA